METMARYKLKIIVLVFNNNGIYGGKFEGEPGTAFPEVRREGGREAGRKGRKAHGGKHTSWSAF